jgi:hypothetical protein
MAERAIVTGFFFGPKTQNGKYPKVGMQNTLNKRIFVMYKEYAPQRS